ncbi:MAG TPA: VCBS repeat-containing protein, partial [Flavobacteriales bacterium]|nr:VCBS repeat-containing protein [Flavobacteriales bacterium]
MRRSILLSLFVLGACSASAQFGPQHFAFESDLYYPSGIMAGDLDGDGDTDAAAYDNGTIWWFANDGTGQFGPRQHMLTVFLSTGTPRALADLDGDGDDDLILNGNSYTNDGNGEMTYYASIPSGGALGMLFEDLDGDGDLDDVVRSTNDVHLLLNNGHGDFSPNVSIGPSGATTSMRAARMDMDGDGDLDLVIGGGNPQAGWYANLGGGNYGPQHVIANWNAAVPFCGDADGDGDTDLIAFGVAPGVRWFANDGAGNLTLMDTLSTSTEMPTAIADLDGDGDVDWSMLTGTSCNVDLLFNQSGTTATQASVENFGGYNLVGTSYATGDIDGDGRLDLLACQGLGLAMWYRNQGDGTISARHQLSRTLSAAYDVAATDLDGDNDLDLVSASYF